MAELIALSPSRANDFVSCPLKFRFRSVDKIPEPPSAAAFKGTLVHAVLEQLFDVPSRERTLDHATTLIKPTYASLAQENSDVPDLFPEQTDRDRLFSESQALVRAYFALELPQNLEPDAREKFVQTVLPGGLKLRGFIDRVDRAPGGEVRLVDYKTGKAPKPQYSGDADFQMRFYALVHYLLTGETVHTLQLMYLGSGNVKELQPTMQDIQRTFFQVADVWNDITGCAESGNWRPKKSPLCNWCYFKNLCPAWGNEAPEAPEITNLAEVEPDFPEIQR
ncbi:hypothetical protein HMPREF0183_1585 [Brevibacterium mcbrellneri ATCC 49030]|uniref:PD-(D/E)XK endonuclease-like domain-containing protein n=1 Tax=Brevibacterium mcbrellneri ATCC 49030 TaxID=585530 RepID=D4YNS5_9MICO|nr:PD-(D/E)XK nuclease family protein [Brevibacterium mcbrellneri]EFG47065.1 hypothetical protein HMPREF0183_1585 [Brevibacterium mcbrellneri ATCC 49030]